MTDPFANKGFVALEGTSLIDLASTPIGGFTPLGGNVVIAAIEHPSAVNGCSYQHTAGFLAGQTYLEGVFYPLPAIALTLTSGKAIGWLQN